MDVMLTVCERLPNKLRFERVKNCVETERRTGDKARFTDLTGLVNEQSRVGCSVEQVHAWLSLFKSCSKE